MTVRGRWSRTGSPGGCSFAGSEHVRRHQMVPPAVAAHLDDVHAELRKLTRQCEQLPRCPGPPVDIAPEALAERVAHSRQTLALAHGAGLAGGLAVVARGADEI